MKKIYQPIVIERSEDIVRILDEREFFKDHEIKGTEFAKEYFKDVLTEKFIDGELDIERDELFTEEEFNKCLREIIVGSILEELREKGMVNSYDDDKKGEFFFLTEEGKKYLKDSGLSNPNQMSQ